MFRSLFIVSILITFAQQPESVKAQNSRMIDPRTGIEIVFVVQDNMFPWSWYEGEINGKAESLENLERVRSAKIVLKAMKKYPVQFLRKNLKKVYVLKSLYFYGAEYGGTNSDENVVFITNRGTASGYTDEFVEKTFHQEFSSILLRNFLDKFDKDAWLKANKAEFKYGGTGVEAIKTGKSSTEFSEEYYKKGFLYQYATADYENDFNSFAETIFLADENFWKLEDSYPGIKTKLKLVLDFYFSVDSVFTREYFKKISKE